MLQQYNVSCFHLSLGPWYVGEILTDVYGFVCVHGVYVMGTLIPGSLTYLHGTMQVCMEWEKFTMEWEKFTKSCADNCKCKVVMMHIK